MTIQFDPDNNRVRIGDRHFPAQGFPSNDDQWPFAKGYTIPLGKSGKSLSIAIGGGTYSDNYKKLDLSDRIDIRAEMDVVEVGYDFGDAPSLYEDDPEPRGFDVTGYVDDEALSRMIIAAMSGNDPF